MYTQCYFILFFLSLQLIILDFKICLWRQDSSLVAVVDSAEPGVQSSSPAAAELFPWCTYMQWSKQFKFVV